MYRRVMGKGPTRVGSKPRANPSSEITEVCVIIRVAPGQTRSKTHDKVGDFEWVDLNLSVLTWLHRTGCPKDANLVNQSVYATWTAVHRTSQFVTSSKCHIISATLYVT